MWHSASTSDPDARRRARGRVLSAIVALAVVALPGASAAAAVLTSATDALARAFPGSTAERATAFLTDEDLAAVQAEAGTRPASKLLTYYTVRDAQGRVAGYGYLDAHLVRTLEETVLVILDPAGAVRRVEVLSFDEPREYLPPPRWMAQFEGRQLSPDLAPNRAIRTMAGATLSSRAVTDCVRRVLALHRRVAAAGARR